MTKVIRPIQIASLAILMATAMTACEDTPNVGLSLVEDESEVVIASDFTLTGRSVDNPCIQSRTITQVLGRINAKGYGNFSSDFMTQFMPSATIETDGITVDDIDSLKLLFSVPNGSYVGDSIAPMGLEVYRLNKQLPSPIYSNDDPTKYYDPADLLASKIYACNALGAADSIQELSYRLIEVKLPLELGRELFELYLNDPSAYALPSTFAQYFPGVYVKNSYGSGRVVEISATMMRMYYHTTTTDSDGNVTKTSHQGNYYAVTPEIVLNNNLSYVIDNGLQQRIDNGETIIVAPVGRDVEIEFPIKDVINYYRANSGSLAVVNTLTLNIPTEEIENDYGIDPPTNLLMVLSSKKDDFFLNGELTDNESSFYAVYDSTNHRYSFSGLRSYLIEMLEKSDITEDDYTFTVTPVIIETETNTSSSYYGSSTSYISSIDPYIGAPTMVKLDIPNASISLTFSKQTLD